MAHGDGASRIIIGRKRILGHVNRIFVVVLTMGVGSKNERMEESEGAVHA